MAVCDALIRRIEMAFCDGIVTLLRRMPTHRPILKEDKSAPIVPCSAPPDYQFIYFDKFKLSRSKCEKISKAFDSL